MPRRRHWTVLELASESELDVEQVLVALWGEGVEYPMQGNSRIRSEDRLLAEKAVGIAGSRQKRVGYWLEALSLSRSQLTEKLMELGFRLHPEASTLPKGAVRRLRPLLEASGSDAIGKSEVPVLQPAPSFTWSPPGAVRELHHLTADELLTVHQELTRDFDGSSDPISPPGVKSRALLESAAGRPATSYGDELKYPTAESASAALLHSVVHNHPFHNGNKRTALVSMMVFLDRHGLVLDSTEDELFKFMIRVAAHDLLQSGFKYDEIADREVAAIASWIGRHSHVIRREDRAVTWRQLCRILRAQNCVIESGQGEWQVISREVRPVRGLFKPRRTLEFRYRNTGDGREVPKSVLKKMRRELQLDPEHGVDAEVFYGDAKGPDFFILRYSQLLKRLSRV